MDTQVAQHLGSAAIVALVGLEAQAEVGIDSVVALLLQLVGSQLVHEADAPSFLLHIDDDAPSLLFYFLHGAMQLFSAVAAPASQNVAYHA